MTQANSIPASQLVQVDPSVLAASGSAVELISLFLSSGNRVPIGTVKSFASASAVAAFFGAGSAEALAAAQYFAGYVGAEQIPESLLFGQYNAAAASAYLWGGSIGTMTIAELQAITAGTLNVTIDGYPWAATGINLSGAASFSAAATLIQTALASVQPTVASVTASIGATATGTGSGTSLTLSAVVGMVNIGDTVTGTGVPANTTIVSQQSGTTGGNGVYTTSQATTASSAAITVSSNYLNVTSVTSGVVAAGQIISGTSITVGTQLVAGGTGTGAVGTYKFGGAQQEVASETVTCKAPAPTVTFDSTTSAFVINSSLTGTISTMAFATGTLAAASPGGLNLTSATGAYLSQGAAAATPSSCMTALTNVTQNFVSFMTVFDPDNGAAGGPQKLLFAEWNSQQNNQYLYVAWDTDVGPQNSANDAACFAAACVAATVQGTACISANDYTIAAAVCGAIASIDTSVQNGRITLAYRQFPSAVATVTNGTVASNLTANGYSFYGAYASRASNFTSFSNGFVTGAFKWIDSYVNQIWLNSLLQSAILVGLQNANSVPYNSAGYSLIEAWCQDPVNSALNFGAIRTGVSLSAAQIAEVNQAAGLNIAPLLQTRGYYLQVSNASPTVRAARQSPPCTLWYCDGGAVQQITLDSIMLQ